MSFRMGWIKDFADPRDFTVDHDEVGPFLLKSEAFGDGAPCPSTHSISDTIDLPPIMDQGSLGSCTANAGSYMYQTYLRVANLDGNEAFSRLFLYKVARNLLGWKGDTGAYLRTMMQSLSLFGAPPERFYPYEPEKFDAEPSGFLYSLARNYQALTYYRLDKAGADPDKVTASIKVNLAADRACVFGFVVFNNLDHSGDVAFPGSHDKQTGGHAICAVGYDDNYRIGEYTGAFQFANSWGENWGRKGFGWLPYEYVRKGLATDWWTMMSAEWLNLGVFK